MDRLGALESAADVLLTQETDPAAIERACAILRCVSDIKKQNYEIEKTIKEQSKIEFEISDTVPRRKSEDKRFFVSLFGPLLTTIILAGTLILQTVQTMSSERDKRAEMARQQDIAEDQRWSDALKMLSQANKDLSPEAAILKALFGSVRYGTLARDEAYQAMIATKSIPTFRDLFFSIYYPLQYENLPKISDLSRDIHSRFAALIPEHGEKPSAEASQEQTKLDAEQDFVSEQISLILRMNGSRPIPVDLHGVTIQSCDLSNVDLENADLTGLNPTFVVFQGTDMSKVTKYQGGTWKLNAWWQASRINPGLLKFLVETAPYETDKHYGNTETSQQDYDEAIPRLMAANAQKVSSQ